MGAPLDAFISFSRSYIDARRQFRREVEIRPFEYGIART